MNEIDDRIALYALTESGAGIVAKLAEKIDECKLFLPEKLKELTFPIDKEITFYPAGGFSEMLAGNWKEYKGHIFVMATGIVVRKIASLLEHKTKDPAVVVCDEKGEYSISLLSGHIGGANRLAESVASILGGKAVITTATDVQGIMAFDELAAINRWTVSNPENIKILNSMLLGSKKIAVVIPEELYLSNYKQRKNIFFVESFSEIDENKYDAAVVLDCEPDDSKNIPLLLINT